MAMEGTHIRFALEYRDAFGAVDMSRYLSGTVYPDSRYVTKIVRALTHGDAFTAPDFYREDDFKKGWAAHLLYDEAQYQAINLLFAELLPPTKVAYGNEHWLIRSALKIIQDIDDLQHFDIRACLPLLDCAEAPNNEDPVQLRSYYTLLQELYAAAPDLRAADYQAIWTAFSCDPLMFGRINEKIRGFEADAVAMAKIRQLHAESMKLIQL